jgi:hypothetical protein
MVRTWSKHGTALAQTCLFVCLFVMGIKCVPLLSIFVNNSKATQPSQSTYSSTATPMHVCMHRVEFTTLKRIHVFFVACMSTQARAPTRASSQRICTLPLPARVPVLVRVRELNLSRARTGRIASIHEASWSKHGPNMVHAWWKHSPNMVQISSTYARNTVQTCSQYVPNMFQIYLKYAPNTLQVCSRYGPNMVPICSKYDPSMTKICSKYTPMVHLCLLLRFTDKICLPFVHWRPPVPAPLTARLMRRCHIYIYIHVYSHGNVHK